MHCRYTALFAFLIIIILAGVASTPANAQWIRCDGPQGGTITNFVVDDGVLYAASGDYDGGDVYATTDNGDHWKSLGNDLPGHGGVSGFAVHRGVIYAGTNAGLFRRSLAGVWDSISPQKNGYRVENILVSDSEIIITVFTDGIYRSTDDGKHWDKLSLGLNAFKFNALTRINGAIFAASQSGGVYRSLDNGKTWQTANLGLTGDDLFAQAIIEHNGKIYLGTIRSTFRSSDNGDTWSKLPVLPSEAGPGKLGISGSTLYANFGSFGIFRSNNDGESWIRVSNETLKYLNLYGFASLNGYVFVGSQRQGVFRSVVTDTVWVNQSDGITSVTPLGLRIFPDASGRPALYAGTLNSDFGLGWVSHDKAENWSSFPSMTDRGVHDFAYRDGVLLAGTDGEGIFRSTDFGATWKSVSGQIGGAGYITGLEMTPNAILANATGFGTGILRSTDLGLTWNAAEESVTNVGITQMFYDSVSGKAFGGASQGMIVSTNEGVTWEAIPGEHSTKQINTITRAGDYLLAGAFGGLFRSADNGVTWTAIAGDLATAKVQVLRSVNGTLYAGTNTSILASSDFGETWSIVAGMPKDVGVVSMMNDENTFYVGTDALGVWKWKFSTASIAMATALLSGLEARVLSTGDISVTAEGHIHSVELLDVLGRTLYLSENEEPSQITIPTGRMHLAQGCYLVRARAGNASMTAKVLLQR
jgi:photosystem II stability/assembly factor-like uncharacterized protein